MNIKTKVVKIECFDCGIDSHMHKKKIYAENCILKNIGRRTEREKLEQDISRWARKIEIAKSAVTTKTVTATAKEFDVCNGRVTQILRHILRISRGLYRFEKYENADCEKETDDIKKIRTNKQYFIERINMVDMYLKDKYKKQIIELESS